MSRYRRQFDGTSYFFTVVAFRRRSILCSAGLRAALRHAIQTVRITRPFQIDAWVLMPDHMHCIWSLPEGDTDYSTRWAEIKRWVSTASRSTLRDPALLTSAGIRRGESTIWQRRFWEHRIRNEHDFERHVDYIHFNPVKHRYVQQVAEWPHSTFHRYVKEGIYSQDWGGSPEIADAYLE